MTKTKVDPNLLVRFKDAPPYPFKLSKDLREQFYPFDSRVALLERLVAEANRLIPLRTDGEDLTKDETQRQVYELMGVRDDATMLKHDLIQHLPDALRYCPNSYEYHEVDSYLNFIAMQMFRLGISTAHANLEYQLEPIIKEREGKSKGGQSKQYGPFEKAVALKLRTHGEPGPREGASWLRELAKTLSKETAIPTERHQNSILKAAVKAQK
ncbi:hypothetical protein Fbal_0466 [Ferrimonas balearica DSM 9799]|uniref:Uncharacterized protein n=1 Tax=Ferrimonas balearica (strain DSM 9799 / CCM 4581 / KCTC 23876 / PAT) TaxID=550540 RepID=E1SP31_FERBD|nr:hypothetical protein Fbal_0466 [Ferrimonas balearica DSM 9799]